jgi:hypothetical protein
MGFIAYIITSIQTEKGVSSYESQLNQCQYETEEHTKFEELTNIACSERLEN